MKTAVYLPLRPEGMPDPSKEFETDQEAWEYIFDNMCKNCKEERSLYFKLHAEGKSPDDFSRDSDEWYAREYPACACEWLVVDSDELKQCETFEDVLWAGGYRPIYRRP